MAFWLARLSTLLIVANLRPRPVTLTDQWFRGAVAAKDSRLTVSSAAMDAGEDIIVYQGFYDRYRILIKQDERGKFLPQ